MKLSTILLVVSLCVADAYSPMGMTTRRSSMTMKRGRGSFKKEIESSDGSSASSGSAGAGMSAGRNWLNVPAKTVKDLPNEEGKVILLDTQAFLLVDKATNPTGAVCVMKYGPETFCFSSSCPQCKIPLTKAKVSPPNEESKKAPRLACDFCKSTFELKTGKKVASEENTGFLGGIAKAVLSAQESAPLPIYQLAEKNGKILFSMD
jgi:nitrite reductase/ring-hydroxylating ferredoxin subunit